MSRVTLILSFLLSFVPAIYAKGADEKPTIITGLVVTSNGEPAPGVTIFIQELSKGEITNESGVFTFKSVPAGTYHLRASLMGMEPVVVVVKAEEG